MIETRGQPTIEEKSGRYLQPDIDARTAPRRTLQFPVRAPDGDLASYDRVTHTPREKQWMCAVHR